MRTPDLSALTKKTDAPEETTDDRPPQVPTFRPRPPARERVEESRPKVEPKAENEPSTSEDEWKLPATSSGGSAARKVALVVVALAVGAGGYVGYTKYWPKPAETEENAVAEGDDASKENAGDVAQSDGALSDDPFGNEPAVKPASETKPRIARHTPDAAPILAVENAKSGTKTGKASASKVEFDLPMDVPDEEPGDSVDVSSLNQDEPEEELESEMPLLASPKVTPRGAPALAEAKSTTAHPTLELDPNDEDPYTVDEERTANASAGKPPAISIVEVNDEAEKEPDFGADPAPQRAVSKTVVVRAASGASAPAAPVPPEEDAWTEDEEAHTTRRPAVDLTDEQPGDDDGSVSAIRPKGTAPVTKKGTPPTLGAESSTRNGVARSSPSATHSGPADESYTIAPNDNFWTISRRQYGSGRYFAALAKHNQDRVADPQRLRPGMQISTPSAATLEAKYPELIDKAAASAAVASKPSATHSTPAYVGDGKPLFERPSAERTTAERPARDAVSQVSASAGYFYSKSGEPMYRVGDDDTLGSIAQKHLGRASRWIEIFEKNRDTLKNPENLTVGTVIRLPPDASKVGWLDSEPKQRR